MRFTLESLAHTPAWHVMIEAGTLDGARLYVDVADEVVARCREAGFEVPGKVQEEEAVAPEIVRVLPDAVRAARLAACEECDRNQNGICSACQHCGRSVAHKAGAIFEFCPAGRWGPYLNAAEIAKLIG